MGNSYCNTCTCCRAVARVAELQLQLAEAMTRQQESVNHTRNVLYAIGDCIEIKKTHIGTMADITIWCSVANAQDLCSNITMKSVNQTGNVHFAIGDLIEIKAPVLVP